MNGMATEGLSPLSIGDVLLGKYRVDRLVGVGGMATVFAGWHLELDCPIAIKQLDPAEASRPEAMRRFVAEARAAARLKSSHVARVFDVGTAENTSAGDVPFLVMELLTGWDLEKLLERRGPRPFAEAVEYVLQACDAVAEAHGLGIIHRDLKPANLFLTARRDGVAVVKLLDFGISKSVARATDAERAPALTQDQETMGSPGYMSPEQVRSAKDVDARTDIWSLGVVLYELVSGKRPFDADNTADLFVATLHHDPASLAADVPDVPPALAAIVARCLAKDREERFATIEELAAALAPFRSKTPVLAGDIPAQPSLPAIEPLAAVSTIRRPAKRSRLVTAVLAAATGIVLVVVGVTKLRNRAEVAPEAIATQPPSMLAPPPPASAATASASTPAADPSDSPAAFEVLDPVAASSASAGAKQRSPSSAPKFVGPRPQGQPRQRTQW